jgi:L-lactate utilization protein LutC
MSARDEMLARIRTAIGPGAAGVGAEPAPEPALRYRTRGELSGPELLDLLASRLADYRAVVHRATAATLADEISAALQRRQARRVVVPPALRLPLPDFVTRSPRPARSSWTARRTKAAGLFRSCLTITYAWWKPDRSSTWCQRQWACCPPAGR